MHKEADYAVIEVHGVGYQVWISNQTYEELPSTGESITLLTYHHFTDNDQRLFGFYKQDEKDLFELLITVKNIGPKLGLTILSGLPADQITGAIAQHDTGTLSQISGIGKKTAERMILELKDKIEAFAVSTFTGSTTSASSGVSKEAVSALESLGYKKRNAQKAVQNALKGNSFDGDVTALVKKALAQMNR